MFRWTTDFLRFWWALGYWNARKTWFRLRGAHRDSCPCQAFSDSGLALDSRCEAVAGWNQPHRFRRVCPLLVETRQGWRCSVDAERVRPFWGRATLYAGLLLGVLYLGGTTAFYGLMRAAHYDVVYTHVIWPPLWPELRHSRESLYAARARQALKDGNFQAAILSLENVCRLNPKNYSAGITLAGLLLSAGQASVADALYERLMHDVPEQRPTTARNWVRSLAAQGNYTTLKPLAVEMLSEDSAHREAWLHALLFAARQTRDLSALAPVASGEHGLPDWCAEAAAIEVLLLQGKTAEALPRLQRSPARLKSPYLPWYQADRLLALGRPDEALARLNAAGALLAADEAALLRIRAFELKGWTPLVQSEAENLLSYPLSPRLAVQFCRHLATRPSPAVAAAYFKVFAERAPALDGESLPVYQASFLAAVLNGRDSDAELIAGRISAFTRSDSKALRGLAAQLRAPGSPAVSRLLPLVPLPIEVVYALQERPPARPAP